MDKPLFDIDQSSLQAEVNSYKPGFGLAWPILFPLKYTPKFNLKGIDGGEGIPVSADRVAFDTKSPIKTRKTIGKWSGELSKISNSRVKNEKDINDYNDLKTLAAASKEDKAAKQYLVDMVYDDVKFVNDGLDYKIELDALRIGSQGIQTFPVDIEGDMATQDIINFNVPDGNFGGASVKWSTKGTADGIKDIVRMQKIPVKKGLKKPMFIFMDTKAFDNLCDQLATHKRLFPLAVGADLITSDMVDLAAVNKYMDKKGYPHIIVLDSYVTIEHKDGKQVTIKPWNENVVTLSPVPMLGYTWYKPVPMIEHTDALQVQGKYGKTTVYSQLNPMLEVTMAEAYVQPALTNRESLCFLNTENTSWNGGAE